MTIAACYISPEGVVLGADSTSTYRDGKGQSQYYNHAQKIYEVGENASLGIVTWGLGGLAVSSHRTLIALFADSLAAKPPKDAAEVAQRWSDEFGKAYLASPLRPQIDACQALGKKKPYDPKAQPAPADARTQAEETQLAKWVQRLTAGFCIGGYVLPDRAPSAFEVIFTPLEPNPETGSASSLCKAVLGCTQPYRQID